MLRRTVATAAAAAIAMGVLFSTGPLSRAQQKTTTPNHPTPPATAPAATEDDEWMSVDEIMGAAEQWAQGNLDESVLKALKDVDRSQVQQLLNDLEKYLNADEVLDLAQLRLGARSALPLLQQYEETEPYALWLETQLDYLDVAEQLRSRAPVIKPVPGQPSKALPNPTPVQQREIWIEKVATEPWPEAAKTYIPQLKPIFREKKVPVELVWVAEVESSFNPRATSPVGARGLYQLMPATAKRFGVRTSPFDERTNPEISARAAAEYLDFLYRKFGDWRLALAAYNAGEGTISRLLERHKACTFDQIAPRLPAETQMYVPRVEAVLLKREGLRLSELSKG
jgi:membrane-bound lytic murein transglycosylase D